MSPAVPSKVNNFLEELNVFPPSKLMEKYRMLSFIYTTKILEPFPAKNLTSVALLKSIKSKSIQPQSST
jgi:hypothetical protein